jgi:ubiquinone/menaquinone biosynthesis C-methylase UbiE
MKQSYLDYTFIDNEEFINTFDELPLWSASFGLLLLKHIELKPNITVLDIGSGAGFPLLELANRLGDSCKVYGIDTWTNANKRAQQKIKNYGLTNVEIIECSAEKIPLASNTVDLIVSNLGINNFDNPLAVFSECARLLNRGGKLSLTTNINGHWKEFYQIFEATLLALGKQDIVNKLKIHQEHRGNLNSITQLYTEGGFKITHYAEDMFEMKFTDGTAFLNHYFVKLGWLSSWKNLLPVDEWKYIFRAVEENLNIYSLSKGGLTLSIPMLYMEGEKIA